jgi:glycosyltransferase involved in cell wall biosynthesis
MMKISICTPTYRTNPDVLSRTWASLKAQTYKDWEWIIWDDSDNGDGVWRQIYGLASDERFKISAHRSHIHSGNIGRLKRQLMMVADGEILLELDHDDELTPDCLELVAKKFDDPEVGFVYSDWCEILEDGLSGRYPNGWAFGYGSDYWSDEHGVWVMSAPKLNGVTMKHIVSAPNHVRCWRSSVYRELNGHNPKFPVADDFELCVRTFLTTKMEHIPRMLYRQHIGPTTTQRVKNHLIATLVKEIAEEYGNAIDERCAILGIEL